MNRKKETLTQEEMKKALNNFLIKSYIANGTIKATPLSVKKNLNFNIKKDILADEMMSVRCGGVDIEIQAQCELENQNDFLKYYDKVSKMITTFDFSKYESMSIEELRSYLLVWDENDDNYVVRGENLIKDKVKRACVGVYSLLKGGTWIYANKNSEDSENKFFNSDIDEIIERINEMNFNGELSEEDREKLINALV
ncbi:hypothetical protein [Lutibacter flavus]|uniref:Uncharacterized protein n=1 Tax=Lutibacter flavus TaxID=691689 RepID=A0A238XJ50_9FLAO|nr:hypothetical protein [Lutibacter flavus]SNR58957.1 hypothetical protein SAMN04488111_1873 [Lutibacter flavus]